MGYDEDGRLDTVSVRVAMVTWRLMGGWQPTTDEVAAFLNMTHTGAFLLLASISRVIPVTCEDGPGNQHYKPKWYAVSEVHGASAIKAGLTPSCQTCAQED